MVLCMVLARTAAMSFNRWADQHIDAKNFRTSNREIPSGKVSSLSALLLVIISATGFVLICYFINSLVFYLSPVALAVVLGYSYAKRFTSLAHIILGIGLSLAPIGSYLVVTQEFSVLPLLLSGAVLTWVAGFDIIYALQDEEFDKQNQLHSIPSRFGKRIALIISIVLHVLSFLLVVAFCRIGNFGGWFLAGTMVFGGLLVYQHLLVKPNDLSKVNMAFFTLNGIASIVFACFVLVDFYLKSN